MRVMLVGNPNSGKTTLFNALTQAHQPVGNWPGVTVEKKEKSIMTQGRSIQWVDLPGLYSLSGLEETGLDEQISAQEILKKEYDVLVNVVDASALERHLYLTSQLLELGCPMILVLSKMDVAQKRGLLIDHEKLSIFLNCPVVLMGSQKAHTASKLNTVVLSKSDPSVPLVLDPLDLNPCFEDQHLQEANARYSAIHRLVSQVVMNKPDQKETLTAQLDRWVLHRFFAFPFFFILMYGLFFVAIRFGGKLQGFLEVQMQYYFLDQPRVWMQSWHWPEALIHSVGYGLGQGLYTTLSFLPVMAFMYFLLSFLEASGYMARVAFVMDRLMQYLGLPGKAFVPLLIGFGCNVPAVIATRTLDAERDRLLTILMMPFMSCSARLAIYSAFVAFFFPKNGHNIVFSLYLMGFCMAILTGVLVRRFLGLPPPAPLFLELPVYQWPSFNMLLKNTWRRLTSFLSRAGYFILPLSIVLSALCFLDKPILAQVGSTLGIIFSPMGITPENWPATIALLSGLLAKEVMMGTLNVLYDGTSLLSHFQGATGAYAYLLFVSLYVPCVSTMAAIRQETTRRWMWFSIIWSMVLAYGVSVLFYQGQKICFLISSIIL